MPTVSQSYHAMRNLQELVDDCIRQEKEEAFIFEMVKQGNSVDGLYPMNAEWQTKYKEWSSTAPTEGARVD